MIQDRLYRSKWGAFNHYLSGIQNNPDCFANLGKGKTDWDDCVKDFNVGLLAEKLHKIGI